MSRYSRNTVILAKIETTPGTDAVPTGASNAIQVSNCSITPLQASNINRDLIRGYFGGSEQLVGTASIEVSFDVELAGSGTAGTAPAWGALVQGCAFAETVTGGSRVEYNPVSTGLKTMTIYYYDDGALHKLLGAMGTFSIKMGVGERPVLSFKFTGLNGGLTAASNATPTLTAWQKPLAITDPNTGDLLFGCTYSAAALSGGTAYPSKGLQLDMGNKVAYTPMLGGEAVDTTDREISGSVDLDLTAAQEVSFMASVLANTTQSLGLQHGTTAGNKIIVHMPVVQCINPKKSDMNGRRLIGYDLRVMPSSGNDDIRIVAF